MSQTVSAVIMTKNYENMIEGALQSVQWADEIVILDGFSTDRTVEICKRYTDKVYQSPWSGSFGTERNIATSHATKDWCLHIDPDERVTPAFAKQIRQILATNPPVDAFEFRKKNNFLGHWMRFGGWYHYSLHFFRRGKARYEGIVHETLKVDGKIGKIEGEVEHYPFQSISQLVQRHNKYSKLEAEDEVRAGHALSDKELQYELKKKPLKRFFKFYVKKKGFLDGMHGLIFSVIFAWIHFINWAKYWELKTQKKGA